MGGVMKIGDGSDVFIAITILLDRVDCAIVIVAEWKSFGFDTISSGRDKKIRMQRGSKRVLLRCNQQQSIFSYLDPPIIFHSHKN